MSDQTRQAINANVMGFDDFNERLEGLIALLIFGFKRHGVEMTEQEAYQYLLWVDNTLMVTMAHIGGGEYQAVLMQVQEQITAYARSMWHAYKTGSFLPPRPQDNYGDDHGAAVKRLTQEFGGKLPQSHMAPPSARVDTYNGDPRSANAYL